MDTGTEFIEITDNKTCIKHHTMEGQKRMRKTMEAQTECNPANLRWTRTPTNKGFFQPKTLMLRFRFNT